MSKPRLNVELLERILDLRNEWEREARQSMPDEEAHWDAVKYYRPIEEWAKAELKKRKLRKESKEMTDRMQPFAQRLIQVSEEMKSEEEQA